MNSILPSNEGAFTTKHRKRMAFEYLNIPVIVDLCFVKCIVCADLSTWQHPITSNRTGVGI